MKTDIKTLQDLFKISYEAYEDSRIEEKEVRDMYHNRQYTDEEMYKLSSRGQPQETFNVVKLFARLLVGYYSTVVNTVKVNPVQESDTLTAMLLHDVVQFTFENNHFETEGDKVKLDGILSGIMCVHENVIETGRKDKYNRPIRRIELSHVPSREILQDPMSRKEDYSDARYIHRFKWVSDDYMESFVRETNSEQKSKKIMSKLVEYDNHVNQDDTEFTEEFNDHFIGLYKRYNSYLLIHSIVVDDKDRSWSVFWCGDEEISRQEITYREVKFPYRVQKLHTSDRVEYYGLFREVIESQKAINQALIKIQLMANSQKVFLQKNSVQDIDSFTDSFNRVNSIIQVEKISGIKVVDLNKDVLQQYAIVDKAFSRIQRVLGVNDSFLGMAYASDSGRKVKLQQNATTLALRYVTTKVEQMYRLIGWDIVNLVKQYYTANEVLSIADEATGKRWIEINKPIEIWSGELDEAGNPIMKTPFQEVLNPDDNEPMVDNDGNFIIAPIADIDTEIAFSEVDLSIDSTAYNDEDEKNQLMIETILQGNIGNVLMQFNPSAYLKAAALSIKTVRTKHSHEIADLIEQTAGMLTPEQQQLAQEGAIGGGNQQPKSSELKLPQNTNEGPV